MDPLSKLAAEGNDQSSAAQTPFHQSCSDEKRADPDAAPPSAPPRTFPCSQQPLPFPPNSITAPPQDLKGLNQQLPPATVYLHQPQCQNPLQPNSEATVYLHPSQHGMPVRTAVTAPGIPVNAPHSLPTPGATQSSNYQYPWPYHPQVPIVVNRSRWNTDLFGCFADPTLTLITFCFPCVTFGQIAEIVDEGQTSCATNGLLYGAILLFLGLPCLISCGYRTKLRYKFGLDDAPAPDWLVHCFCESCALCQAYRELQSRSFNPAIGWVENQRRQAMMAPAAQVMMSRI